MTADKASEHQTDAAELDPNSLAAIRDLLASEAPAPEPEPEMAAEDVVAQEPPRRQAPPAADMTQAEAETLAAQNLVQEDLVQAAVAASLPDGAKKKRKWGLKRSLSKPKAAAQPAAKPKAQVQSKAKPQQKASSRGASLLDTLKAKVMGYRPTRRHIALAIAAYLILFRPWLVLAVVVLLVFTITAIFLILGYDGFWRQIMRFARWYAQRHPSRSVEIHRKLDNFAMKFDAFLDRFPEGTVDGLYLPDFGDLAAAEAKHDEALDRRFDKLRESEA